MKVNKKEVTITVMDAETVSHNLSDILCWWEGFKTGVKLVEDGEDTISPAQNGINAIRFINLQIKDNL